MALLSDTHLEVIPLVFEEPHGYAVSYDLDRLGEFVSGSYNMPDARQREVFHFKAISNGEVSLRQQTDQYFSGGQLRVYRLYPANLVEWSEDNPNGYSDMVHPNPSGASYPWYSKMEIWSFDLDGVNLTRVDDPVESGDPGIE